ncbi:MAG: hypothetical protein J1E31_04785 [Helicobacter sp.]|nr:hypothetical protein [Helicobacter sp.]
MISGIDSNAAVVSGNLSALKKALNTEEALMNSLIGGMQQVSQASLQTQSQAPATSSATPQNNQGGRLDILA